MYKSLDEFPDEITEVVSTYGRLDGHFQRRGSNSVLSPGPDRRAIYQDPNRMSPYPMRQPREGIEVEATNRRRPLVPFGGINVERETKVYISNLDYGVTDADILLLFSEVGELKNYSIHYDKSGRSKGTAEVVFFRPEDAIAAIRRYNDCELDGKRLIIEPVGENLIARNPLPAAQRINWGHSEYVFGRGQGDRADGSFHGGIVGAVGGQDNGIGGNSRGGGRDSFGGQDNRLGGNFHGGGWGTFGGQDNRVGGNFRGGGLGHFGGQDNRVGRNLRDGGHGTFGGGRSMSNTGRNNRKKLTVKDLDAELDQYRSEAKKAKSDSA